MLRAFRLWSEIGVFLIQIRFYHLIRKPCTRPYLWIQHLVITFTGTADVSCFLYSSSWFPLSPVYCIKTQGSLLNPNTYISMVAQNMLRTHAFFLSEKNKNLIRHCSWHYRIPLKSPYNRNCSSLAHLFLSFCLM